MWFDRQEAEQIDKPRPPCSGFTDRKAWVVPGWLRARVLELRESGASWRQIVADTGMSRSTVRTIIKRPEKRRARLGLTGKGATT